MYAQRKEGKETKLRLFRDGRRSCSQFTRADRSVHTVAHKDKILPRFQNTSQNPKTLPRIQNTSQNPKTLPRIENTSQNPKTLPRIENTSQNPKTHPGIQKDFPEFWEVFLDSGKCFWILESVLSLRATVHKWHAKFRPGKFRPGIALSVPFSKNDREGLNPVSKMALKIWNTNFSLEYSVRKKHNLRSGVIFFFCFFAFWLEREKNSA